MVYYESKSKKVDSPMLDLVCELNDAGFLINVVSYGAYEVQIIEHQTEEDHLTVQNGMVVFTGSREQAMVFLQGAAYALDNM